MNKIIIAYSDGSELFLALNGQEYAKFINWVENEKDDSFHKIKIKNVVHYLYKQNFKYIKFLGYIDTPLKLAEPEETEHRYEDIYDDLAENW
jgi:hypothetical protein